jgi:phage-related protein
MADQHDKPLVWLGDSRDCVRSFPVVARQRSGFELREVQKGKEPYKLEADAGCWARGPGNSDSNR